MHLYIKLAFCLALLTDKLSQPNELRRNQPWSSKAREDKWDPAGTVQTAHIKKQAKTTYGSPATWPLHQTNVFWGLLYIRVSSSRLQFSPFHRMQFSMSLAGWFRGGLKTSQFKNVPARIQLMSIEYWKIVNHLLVSYYIVLNYYTKFCWRWSQVKG